MSPELIGHTSCEVCRGTGKSENGAACSACQGAGLEPVFRQPTVPSPPAGSYTRRRRFPRYYTDLPLSLRDQQERELAGRCVVIAEGGLAAVLPEPLPAGSVVTLQLPIPTHPTVLEAWAVVRNQLGLRHGFEFVSVTDSERVAIRQFCNGLMVQSEPVITKANRYTAGRWRPSSGHTDPSTTNWQ